MEKNMEATTAELLLKISKIMGKAEGIIYQISYGNFLFFESPAASKG